jgi:hypothetical protein
MKMISHQDICVNRYLGCTGMVLKQMQHAFEVSHVPENRLAVRSALDQVMRLAGNRQPGKSCHVALRTLKMGSDPI